MTGPHTPDIAIIGAGIAGASLAHALLAARPGLAITLIEAEAHPGYHTTGRSAAFFAETYGGPRIQPLSTASRAFLEDPPSEVAGQGFLKPRGALHLARAGDGAEGQAALRRLAAEFAAAGVRHELLDGARLQAMVPMLRPGWAASALFEPGCADIDVAAFHQGLLAAARRAGAALLLDHPVRALAREGDAWAIHAGGARISAPLVVNAAGAWVDPVAALAGLAPLGFAPLRRTIVVAETDPPAPADLPLVMDAGGALYFRPDAGRLWISPHDETPDQPCDVRPDELDIAITIARFEAMCDWRVRRPASTWAGLRTFAPDRLPAIGADPRAPGFHWCAGQGGWGIQTAPALAALCAADLLGEPPRGAYQHLDPRPFRVARLVGV